MTGIEAAPSTATWEVHGTKRTLRHRLLVAGHEVFKVTCKRTEEDEERAIEEVCLHCAVNGIRWGALQLVISRTL